MSTTTQTPPREVVTYGRLLAETLAASTLASEHDLGSAGSAT
jgi:hypothetical protein